MHIIKQSPSPRLSERDKLKNIKHIFIEFSAIDGVIYEKGV